MLYEDSTESTTVDYNNAPVRLTEIQEWRFVRNGSAYITSAHGRRAVCSAELQQLASKTKPSLMKHISYEGSSYLVNGCSVTKTGDCRTVLLRLLARRRLSGSGDVRRSLAPLCR